MKTLLFIILSLFGSTLLAEKIGSDYRITASAQSKGLKRTEAMFIFSFLDPNGNIIKTSISASQNGINKTLDPNAKGRVLLKVKPGKHIFQFLYNTQHFEIYTDSIKIDPGYLTEISVFFRSANSIIIVDKPVIYVYSKKTENVSIKLDLKGEFLFTYPQYSNGWNFTAHPDGTILMNEKKYHYLFWDGKLNIETEKLDLSTGFVIEKNNLVSFFEEKLKAMGLNSQEIEDYITYWCPRMSANEKNYIHFIFNEDYNKYASISIHPKPEQLFRVCMLWSKASENTAVKEQKIESFTRSGFTVVEWGGTELKDLVLQATL